MKQSTKNALKLNLLQIENTEEVFKHWEDLINAKKSRIINKNEYVDLFSELCWKCICKDIPTIYKGVSLF
jgi:GMP synthase PP-ATPase subunit